MAAFGFAVVVAVGNSVAGSMHHFRHVIVCPKNQNIYFSVRFHKFFLFFTLRMIIYADLLSFVPANVLVHQNWPDLTSPMDTFIAYNLQYIM